MAGKQAKPTESRAATRKRTREDQEPSKPSKKTRTNKQTDSEVTQGSSGDKLPLAQKPSGERPLTRALRPRYPPKKELKLSDLEGVRTLGEGGFGAVCLARVKDSKSDGDGTVVAVKVQQKKTLLLTHHQRNILGERKFLSNLPWSPFVAGILDLFQDTKNVYYVLEFMGLNTLHSERHRRPGHCFTDEEGPFYLANIVLGLEHLHKHGLAHCDLKPNNILVGDDGYLTIADLGLAKDVSWKTEWDSFGSPEYMPPETFDESYGLLDTTLDWWSVGCIVYEMMSGERAFQDFFGRTDELHRRICEKRLGSNKPFTNGSGDAHEIIDGFIEVNPRFRLGVNGTAEIKRYSWFKNINWTDIEARTVEAPYVPGMLSTSTKAIPQFEHMLKQEFVPGLALVEPPTALKFIGKDIPFR
ncbi:kinase-like protein [Schizopora paradoxa]|uniref:cAMP-dependent protein kinase n=1 Tax=Schizopora paradoxa TaxID=27342 RepID=A0A0H2SQ12_9AGAM|nr:kinase-like protein [Schizopora paradoxa]